MSDERLNEEGILVTYNETFRAFPNGESKARRIEVRASRQPVGRAARNPTRSLRAGPGARSSAPTIVSGYGLPGVAGPEPSCPQARSRDSSTEASVSHTATRHAHVLSTPHDR